MKSKFKNDFKYILNVYKKNCGENDKKFMVFQQWIYQLDFFIFKEGFSKLKLIENLNQTLPKNILDFYALRKKTTINSKNYKINHFAKLVFKIF